jgi:organic hydroperoxide reductase OsmC/OhrA
MAEMTVHLRSIHGSEAAVGWAGSHTVIVDRPKGKARGAGLGFNGGELLGLAIGGCLCNDLQYVAHDLGVHLSSIQVDVTIQFEGEPSLATNAAIVVKIDAPDNETDLQALINRAMEISTVSNSLRRGLPIKLEHSS